ncbi:carbohydrate porin [Methylocystis sp. B8]|uniref:carbohydrate porin n=1 Tax=Methylocystis sp. B8 TaxID=544938 RepID=UPI0010FF1A36|nr:carbohydrate porin [Methylocystis sp. B8]TLG78557.1 porin [Methylocystis sp. B8]
MRYSQRPSVTIGRSSRKRRLLAVLLAFLFPFAAWAEDAPPPVFNWAGLYLGASFGAGFPLHRGERLQAGSGFGSPVFDLYPASETRTGVTVGAQAGYNWQHGPWVWGFETELALLDGRQPPNGLFATSPAYPGAPIFTLNPSPAAKFFASVRGRLGISYDRALLYLTGGVAAGGERGAATLSFGGGNDFAANWSQSSRMKYIIGGGLEYAFAADWSARAEYLFLSQSLNTQTFDNGSFFLYHSRIRNENHILRFGLNYHFGESDRIPGALEYGPHRNVGDGGDKEDDVKTERYSVHAQTVSVVQGLPRFPAKYDGPGSFPSRGICNALTQNNLFLGLRLWEGGAVYLNPEVDEGFGPHNALGAAAYPNGIAQKLGRAAPYMRFQRYFLREIIGLDTDGDRTHDPDEGSRSEVLESVQNQVSGRVDKDRIIITLGKFAVGDVFDDNIYAHDPTTGFLNFAFNSLGAFDYAADAWGYTHGLAVEWKQNWWTLRGGVFQLSSIPNGPFIEQELFRQYMGVTELEARYEMLGQPGAIKFLLFGDNGRFAKYQDAINLALVNGTLPPDLEPARRRHFKPGGGVNIKQQIVENLGFFLRASMSDGRYEIVDYTDLDRQLSMGLVADGAAWGREDDEIGVAGALSGITGDHVAYLGLGGRGVFIYDGALTYGGEKNLEAYYKLGFGRNIDTTFDYQLFVNLAHNSARGPVNVFGLRLRAAF